MERNPERDKFEKREKTKFIVFGTIAALAIAAGIEFFAFKGKHFDELISKFKNKKTTEPPKTETPKAGETPKVETPKAGETPMASETPVSEVKPTGQTEIVEPSKTSGKVRIEKVKIEQPKLIQGIDRSKYPKSYTQDGFEITENLCTTSEGHEYIYKIIKKDGNVIKKLCTQNGSIKTHYETIYEKGIAIKDIWYKEDGTTIDYIFILDEKGNVIEKHLHRNGKISIEKRDVPKPKLIQGIDRSKYPKNYTQDGFEITEELFTTSEGHEYIRKTIKKDGNVIKKLCTQNGSIKTYYETIYENGVNIKDIWYKEDGTTINYISILDEKGNVIERQYPV